MRAVVLSSTLTSKWNSLEVLRLRYNKEKIQWLALAVTGITFMVISASETWGSNASSFYSNLDLFSYFIYIALFGAAILSVHMFETSKLTKNKRAIIIVSSISVIIDLATLLFATLFVLVSINQLSSDTLKSLKGITFLILPWALGAVTLSSLSVDIVYKRTKDLEKKIEELKEKTAKLTEDATEREKNLVDLEKKFSEFKKKKSQSDL